MMGYYFLIRKPKETTRPLEMLESVACNAGGDAVAGKGTKGNSLDRELWAFEGHSRYARGSLGNLTSP